MQSLKKIIEDHPVYVYGLAFAAGWGAHIAWIQGTDRLTITSDRLKTLENVQVELRDSRSRCDALEAGRDNFRMIAFGLEEKLKAKCVTPPIDAPNHEKTSKDGVKNNNAVSPSTPTQSDRPNNSSRSQPQAVGSLSGRWGSNIDVEYQITQNGSSFVWNVVPGKIAMEQGRGEIVGSNVSASWRGSNGSGSASGEANIVDGRVTLIRWSNGVVFRRIE